MRAIKILLATLFSIAIASCSGGGGSTTPAATSVTISGSVVKGPVIGAIVTFFGLNADGSKAAQLGKTTTDDSGNYTVTLTPAPTTPFLAETSGGIYVDEATGSMTTLTVTDVLQAVLPAGTTLATITPLTHIAAARAQALAAGGTPLATAVDSSNTGVASQYGIANIVTTLPPAANDAASVATSTRDERIYALVLAGIAQRASDAGVRAIDLANALAEDAKDGILDGQNGGVAINVPLIAGGSVALGITAGTTDIQTAINDFIASLNNQTNLTQVAIPLTPVNLGVNTAGTLYTNTPALPAAVSLQNYTATLTATGGTPPYTCAVTSGSLPEGYVLVPSTCQITGTAGTVTNTTFSAPFVITLTDSAEPPNTVEFAPLYLTTTSPPPTFTPDLAGVMTVNVQGSTPVAIMARDGTPPYYFVHDSFAYGAHPLGTVLDVNGNLTGTPSQTGVFNFKVCVIDLVGAKDCQMTSVTVNPAMTLTASKAGTGSGTVTSSPTGINCGATCSAGFANGASVTLTATPATGSTFSGWSGACSGTGSCVVTMDAAKNVTATFIVASTTTVYIGGPVATGTVITLDGVQIKGSNSENLDNTSYLTLGNHSLSFTCASTYCFAYMDISTAYTGFTITPTVIDLTYTDLPPNATVTYTLTLTSP